MAAAPQCEIDQYFSDEIRADILAIFEQFKEYVLTADYAEVKGDKYIYSISGTDGNLNVQAHKGAVNSNYLFGVIISKDKAGRAYHNGHAE